MTLQAICHGTVLALEDAFPVCLPFPRLDEPSRRVVPIRKHTIQLSLDQPTSEQLPEYTERRLVLDLVSQDRSPLAIIEEAVAMIPGSKRA